MHSCGGSAVTGTARVDLALDVEIGAEEEDDYGLLSRFNARFHQRTDGGDIEVGRITGWIVQGCGDEDFADAADAVSTDAARSSGTSRRRSSTNTATSIRYSTTSCSLTAYG